MKSYQILSVIGGVLGMIIVLVVYAVFSVASIMATSFGHGLGSQSTGLVSSLVGVSVVLYIIAIVIPFTLKKPKTIGIILFILAFATLISASYFGIIGMALLVAGGISAIRQRDSDISKSQAGGNNTNATDILMERYAKGEITKEQFDEMKERLDELKE